MTPVDPLVLAERLEKMAATPVALTLEIAADFEAMLAGAKALRQFAWRPIREAPKDGTCFLGCTDKGAMQIIKRNKHLSIWVDVEGRESYRHMTHWMPLPAPPQTEPTKE